MIRSEMVPQSIRLGIFLFKTINMASVLVQIERCQTKFIINKCKHFQIVVLKMKGRLFEMIL